MQLVVHFNETVKSFDARFREIQTVTKYIGGEALEHYKGTYDVTPLITSQVLYTNQKFMDDNVRVDMIPTKEISNASGGVTFIVGG